MKAPPEDLVELGGDLKESLLADVHNGVGRDGGLDAQGSPELVPRQ